MCTTKIFKEKEAINLRVVEHRRGLGRRVPGKSCRKKGKRERYKNQNISTLKSRSSGYSLVVKHMVCTLKPLGSLTSTQKKKKKKYFKYVNKQKC